MTACKAKEAEITQHAKQQLAESERKTRSQIGSFEVPLEFELARRNQTPCKKKTTQKRKLKPNHTTPSRKKTKSKTTQRKSTKAAHPTKTSKATPRDSGDEPASQLKNPLDTEIQHINTSETVDKLIPAVSSGMKGGPFRLYKTKLPLVVIDQDTDHTKLALKAVLVENRHLANPVILGYTAN